MAEKNTPLSLWLPFFLGIALMACQGASEETKEKKRPNVLVIITDDQRWDALSIAGNPSLKTPNIDRLGHEGAYFKNYFCTTSLCSPSRASILSGKYAHSHGVVNNFTEFPDSIESFPGILQANGYQTAYIGKWHMGENNDRPRKGFDYFVTHKGQGSYYDTEFNINGAGAKKIKGYYTNVVTDMAKEWLKKDHGDKPFVLILGHKAPHSFYTPEPKYAHAFDNVSFPYPKTAFNLEDKPDWIKQRLNTWHGIYGPLFEWRKKFPDSSPAAVKDFEAMNRAYWETILSVDDSVGEIYNLLKERGELDNTIIVFTADNGLLTGEHGMVDKRTMHEPSIRIPMVIRYPGLRPSDKPVVVSNQVLTIDLAPTILELCGAPGIKGVQGQSFVKLVQNGASNWRTSWFYEYNYEKQFPYTPNVRGVRTAEWKYIHYPTGDGSPDKHLAELYNLKEDPLEDRNLIHNKAYASKLKELKATLEDLLGKTGALPDKMPLDEGIKTALPDQSIR